MKQTFTLYYTADTHGFLFPVNYATGQEAPGGLLSLSQQFHKDGNTLVLDGGDTIQGSPFTYFTNKKELLPHPVAEALNSSGYDYITLGNHDFNYGQEHLWRYLTSLKARCLCANVTTETSQPSSPLEAPLPLEPWAIHQLENGLKIGIVGVVTDYVNLWERPQNLEGFTIDDAFAAARAGLAAIRDQADITICLYHGGLERDLHTGKLLSNTTENVGWRICQELDFDLLLSAHQHMPIAGQWVEDTYVVQPPCNATAFLKIQGELTADDDASSNSQAVRPGLTFTSQLIDAQITYDPSAVPNLLALEKEVQVRLDQPAGHLSRPLLPQSKVEMALQGTPIADFFNQVQLHYSQAQLSCTCLANEIAGFQQDVTVRDILATYIYPNTLTVLEVTGAVLLAALERTASYLELDAKGQPTVSDRFLKPKVEHYNFDFYAGLTCSVDLRQPVGSRVRDLKVGDRNVAPADTFTLCMNNYRATGAGGYEMFQGCPVIQEINQEISELILDYLSLQEMTQVESYPRLDFL